MCAIWGPQEASRTPQPHFVPHGQDRARAVEGRLADGEHGSFPSSRKNTQVRVNKREPRRFKSLHPSWTTTKRLALPMAHAIFKTGGKQFRATEGDKLRIPSIEGNPGDKVTFGEVLAVEGDKPQFGQPLVAGAKVEAEILGQRQDKKLIVYKFRRRKRYQRKNGHRQRFTEVKVLSVSA